MLRERTRGYVEDIAWAAVFVPILSHEGTREFRGAFLLVGNRFIVREIHRSLLSVSNARAIAVRRNEMVIKRQGL